MTVELKKCLDPSEALRGMDMVRDFRKRNLYPLAVGGTEAGKVQRRKADRGEGAEVDVVHRPRV